MTTFIIIAVVLSAGATALLVRPLLSGGSGSPWAAVAVALGLPCAVLLGYMTASNHGWDQAAGATGPAPPPGTMEEALAALESRLQVEPGDIDGWLLLGSAYTSLGRFDDAGLAYQRALQLSGGQDIDAKLGLAEALLLLDPDQGAAQAARLIDEALAVQPQNPKGLWYAGLLARSRGDLPEAIRRWETLLALGPPEQVRGVLERELAGLRGGVAAASPGVAAGPRLGVRVSIDPALSGRVAPGAALFVFVRESGSDAGPPLAAVRRDAGGLPAEIWVSNADVMLPGRSLNGLGSAQLVARVANGGDATARAGDLFGEASWAPAEAGEPVQLVINQVYEP
jgi:cytochrome c-type biogenesis protein CcmH